TMGGWLVPAAREEETLRSWAAQPEPTGTPHDTMPAGYLIARCKDGRWIQVTSTTLHIFRNYVKLLGLDAIYEDPRFRGIPYVFPTPADKVAFMAKMRAKMEQKTSEEWMRIFTEDGNIGGEPYITTREFMSHPQALHIGLVIEADDPRVGKMKQISPLAQLWDTPSRPQGPAPDLGEHTGEVLGRLGDGLSPWRSVRRTGGAAGAQTASAAGAGAGPRRARGGATRPRAPPPHPPP